MKNINKLFCMVSMTAALCFAASCDDANEYADTNTDNPSWGDSENASHPESIANSVWERGSGMKYNAYGEEVQGFVESMSFETDSVVVKMSEGVTSGTWTDESNTASTPKYEYAYSNVTGKVEVMKMTKDEKGKVSKSVIFTGIAVSGKKEVLTVVHFSDTPQQTYLVRK